MDAADDLETRLRRALAERDALAAKAKALEENVRDMPAIPMLADDQY